MSAFVINLKYLLRPQYAISDLLTKVYIHLCNYIYTVSQQNPNDSYRLKSTRNWNSRNGMIHGLIVLLRA